MAQQKITMIAELKDKLSGSLQSIEKQSDRTAKAVDDHGKRAEKAYDKAGDAAKKSADDTKKAGTKAERALTSVGSSADGMAGSITSATNKADRALASLTGDAQGSADKIDRALAAAGERGGDAMVSNFKSAGSRMSSQGTAIGKETGSNIAAGIESALADLNIGDMAGAAATVGVAGGMNGSLDRDRAARNAAIASGQDPAAIRDMGDEARSNGFGATAEDAMYGAATIVATLDLEPGSEVAQRLLEGNLTMAEVFGLESKTLAMAVNIGVEKFDIDAETAQDVVGNMLQSTAQDSQEEVLEAWREYAPLLAGTGIEAETFAAMLSSAGDLGPMQVDKAGDAMKEFGILAMDTGNESIGDAYAAAGLDQTDIASRLQAGDATAFTDVTAAIAAMEDPVERANAAIAIFGTPLEDMGTTEIEENMRAWSNLDATVQDATGTVQAMQDQSVEGTAADWDQAMIQLENSFSEVGDALAPLISLAAGFISAFAPAIAWLSAGLTVLTGTKLAGAVLGGQGLAGVLSAIGIGGGDAGRGVGRTTGALGGLKGILTKHPILALAGIVWGAVEAFGYLYENSESFRRVADGIAGIFTTIDEKIRAIGEGIEGLIRDKFPELNGAMNTMETNFDSISGGAAREAVDNTPIGGNPLFTMAGEALGINDWLRDNHLMGPKKEKAATGGDTAIGGGMADGGWTTAGTINVGERGREFITNAWASNKLESASPGGLAYMNATGEFPSSGNVTIAPTIRIDGAQQPAAIGAEVEAALERLARKAQRGYMTPTARGAN